MKTIVCGVDGSPGARAALQVAASLGEQLETWLVPVYVLDRLTDVGLTAERVAANVPDDEAPDAQAEARGEVGDVAERLAAAASDESALMIVLGRPQSRSLTHMSAGALCGQAARADGRARTYRAATARRRPDAGATHDTRRFPMSAVAVPYRDAIQGGEVAENVPPIIAAVDRSAASRAAIGEAVRLAHELDAPIVFVYVRRGPAGFFGAPVHQRRLTKEMARARRVLDRALAVAASAGVRADAEILEGSPRRRIPEFARDRDARLVVVGSRRRKLGPSVSSGVVRAAGRPVVVAKGLQRLAVAGKAAECSPAS